MSTPVLRFRRDEVVTRVPGDGVFIASESGGSTRLHGAAISAAAPLLDGTRDQAQVVQALADELGVDQADRAVRALLDTGHVVAVDPNLDDGAAGYLDALGRDGDSGVRRLHAATIAVLRIGQARNIDLTPIRQDAEATVVEYAGIEEVPPSVDLLLVVTDDYQRSALREINRVAVHRGLSWLLVKPFGTSAWVGPLVHPGVTACFECLHVRLASKNLPQSYLRQRGALTGDATPTALGLRSGIGAALRLAIHTAQTHLATQGEVPRETARRDGDVVTLDLRTLETERHHLDPRPQCPVCGEASLQERRMSAPIHLDPQPKAVRNDGGHRAMSPGAFVTAHESLVSPITGPVSHLTPSPSVGEGLHVYTAGQNFAVPMRGLADLRAGLRSMSCGKGQTAIQAKASALGEAIERYSGLFHGDEPRVLARAADLAPQDFVHPNELHHFSDAQFRDRAEWNQRPSHFHWVGDPLDPHALIEWTPVWSMSEQRFKLVPTATMFYAYHSADYPFYASSNSNGCAAGSSLADAILQGFMELVERDATAIWWYNRLRRPRVDLDSFDNPYFGHWQRQYRALHRDAWVLDLTTDLGIPTVVAVSYRTDKPAQDILFALGSHFDLSVAIGRALSEMNQFIGPVAHLPADGSGSYTFSDQAQVDFWKHETIERNPYLVPDPDLPATRAGDYVDVSTDDLAQDVDLARRIVERHGMELLVLDQTRIDIGLPVARVMVPGLRHFWPRYAPGRLYDVPVQLGWADRPTDEAELNPIGVFI
ncbi:TOMM precursor leader peptide-binding protein [Flexivirga caeni]|uniref:Goadsporin biosynthetic protein n=1 Tax=Flexivirga caeni TaxID=2294115 RepID=A0A3M9M6K1_9MICO|nr:TOMM precursor leader peptide-binding protein [Flexivirga caeni]RNI21116.1 goadsporin biosynthetic protein [Flexivirga caeni]